MLNISIPPLDTLQRQFQHARPFKHICIDNFLVPSSAEKLLQQFPRFDSNRAVTEMGTIGGKSTREDVRALGSGYVAVDELISSPAFLNFLSDMTGIPDLLYDPEYFGGGTHDNVHGQELDVHVDFNYHKSSNLHRRLNLIIYLNKDWESHWGGGIEIHSNPRQPDNNEIITFDPIFNRCVIFETNEFSWHGFSRIKLPEDKRHLSRKSFAVYFYSASRPAEEIAPPHNTFYIQRPMPKEIREGVTLTHDQVMELQGLINTRDTWITFYQNLELSMANELATLRHLVKESFFKLRVNSLGYISQVAQATDYHLDQWIGDTFRVTLLPHKPLSSLTIELRVPPELPSEHKIEIRIDEQPVAQGKLHPGESARFSIPCNLPVHKPFHLEIKGDSFCPKELGSNSDERKLVAVLEKIIAQHSEE